MKILIWIALAAIVVFGLIRMGMSFNNSAPAVSGPVAAQGVAATTDNGIQKITIGYSGRTYNYSPDIIRLKRGVPTEVTLNLDQLQGCTRSFISRGLGINTIVEPGNNVIRFTPDTVGRIAFNCSMGMVRGTFIVE